MIEQPTKRRGRPRIHFVNRYYQPGRREYQQQYRQEATLPANCVICGKRFMQNIYDQGKTCSRPCTGVLAGRTRRERRAQ